MIESIVIKRGEGIRKNPLLKLDEQYKKRKCKRRNPRSMQHNEENNGNSQSLDYGAGVDNTGFDLKKAEKDDQSEDGESLKEIIDAKIFDTLEYLIRFDTREIKQLLSDWF